MERADNILRRQATWKMTENVIKDQMTSFLGDPKQKCYFKKVLSVSNVNHEGGQTISHSPSSVPNVSQTL